MNNPTPPSWSAPRKAAASRRKPPGQRTQVIWPDDQVNPNTTFRVRPPWFDRWLRLMFIKEGSPLCN